MMRMATLCLLPLAASCGRASPPLLAAAPAPAAVNADVRFMQGMITHHAQALAMTRLVPSRTNARDIALLAERIAVSQRDEIALMQQWLRARGHQVPDTAHVVMGHHMPGDSLMPGMLTPAELDSLRAVSGAGFERRFLLLMIRHHEGALAMVQRLLATPGGAQDAEVNRFAVDVDADQRAEIARMRRMLAARGSPDAGH
jgi:uncharacterized protein (DUF305 family)